MPIAWFAPASDCKQAQACHLGWQLPLPVCGDGVKVRCDCHIVSGDATIDLELSLLR